MMLENVYINYSKRRQKMETYQFTEQEEKILSNFFNPDQTLKTFPAKESKKLIILKKIKESFKENCRYSESEVNTLLEKVYPDYVEIRRALIDYKMLFRTDDCRTYWLNPEN